MIPSESLETACKAQCIIYLQDWLYVIPDI